MEEIQDDAHLMLLIASRPFGMTGVTEKEGHICEDLYDIYLGFFPAYVSDCLLAQTSFGCEFVSFLSSLEATTDLLLGLAVPSIL